MHPYRTHTCGELRAAHAGSTARLSGWVHRKRDHGGLLFIDLRDHHGLTQVVAEPENGAVFKLFEQVRLESVVTVTGRVAPRPAGTVNAELPTGAIELRATEAALDSAADALPLQVNSDEDYGEEVRLRYRFLDLRRDKVHRNIVLRSRVIASIRRRMIEQGFTEFQTPILTASSPEGARDFVFNSLRPTEAVHRIQRVRSYKGEPFMVENVAVPAKLFPGLAKRKDIPSRIVLLAQEFSVLLGKGEERLCVGTAAKDVAGHLKLAEGAPVLVLDRIVHDLDGQPVEWRLARGNFVGKYYMAEFA